MKSNPMVTPNQFADYWRNIIGVNVIPADSKNKIALVKWKDDPRGNWQVEPIPQSIHDEWKQKNMFKDGMAVICGKVFHNDEHRGKWLNGIDCDNKLGLQEMCPGGIDSVAKITLVEQHANKDKCHIYFYTDEPLQSQAPLQGDSIPKIEIKSGGRFLLYCAGGIHKDGSKIEILGNDSVKTLDKDTLEARIDGIFTKYGLEYLKNEQPIQHPIYQRDTNTKLHSGENRGKYILSYLDSKKIKNPELDDNDLYYLARKYEKENCAEAYDDDKIRSLVKQANEFGTKHRSPNNNGVKKLQDPEQMNKFLVYFIKKYDIVTPFNTDNIYYREGLVHILGIDGILKEELKGWIIKNRDFNDLKFNIGIESQIPKNEINPFDNDFIGLVNVILDPITFEPITEKVYVNSILQREYRLELKEIEDKILKAVQQILGDQYEKFLAICVILLTGKNDIKKMSIFDGPPDSGKTTLLEILIAFVGVYTSIHIRKLQEDTRLLAKCTERLNVTDEAENCIVDPDKFKQIIDGAVQQESWKYEKELSTYDPNKTLHVGGSNGIPDIRGEAGVAKRIIRIPCPNHFEKDEGWKKALITKDNLDRFLLSVIDYAKRGVDNPLLDMGTAEKTTQFEMMGDPVGYFKEHYMYESEGEYCLPSKVFEAFNKFCKQNNIHKEFTPQKFARTLHIASKPQRIDGTPVKVYRDWSLVGESHSNETLT